MQKGIKLDLMQSVLEHFDLHVPITTEVLADIASNLNVETFKRGDIICQPSTVERKWYFIEKGLVRAYYYRGDTQVTFMFLAEGNSITVFEKYYSDLPSKIYIEAIEPSELYTLDRVDSNRMRQTYLGVAELHRRLLAQFLVLSQKHLDLLKFESAEARYEKLMERIPHLILRVPSIYVASYLGLTPETVSRVRARLAKSRGGRANE